MYEKFLFVQKFFNKFFANEHKIGLNVKIIVYKKIKTYKRIKLFNFLIKTKIFNFKIVFKIKRNLKKKKILKHVDVLKTSNNYIMLIYIKYIHRLINYFAE